MKKVTTALIGAGQRGMHCYAPFALRNPHKLKFIAVAEPDPVKREQFRLAHGISPQNCFTTGEELLEKPQLADAVLVCTQDRFHYKPTLRALEQGYHVLVEKPMSTDPLECIVMEEYAQKYDRKLMVGHVLRYTSFFTAIKELLTEGAIGDLVTIQHNENVGYWHMAHSYVRGNWRNSTESSPMILAKSCHDLDILLWLAGADCHKLSSFGSLTHFKQEHAPVGAPLRCTDGCPVEKDCAFYAPRLYLTEDTGWPASVISKDTSLEGRTRALQEGPYGRCVYHCDNNVVDHQVVSIEFANQVTAAFTMSAFTNEISRTIKLMGTQGELRGAMEKNEIEITHFATGQRKVIHLQESPYGHSGGDDGIMRDFVELIGQEGNGNERLTALTMASTSVQSHMMAFAAEESRLAGRMIELPTYMQQRKSSLASIIGR